MLENARALALVTLLCLISGIDAFPTVWSNANCAWKAANDANRYPECSAITSVANQPDFKECCIVFRSKWPMPATKVNPEVYPGKIAGDDFGHLIAHKFGGWTPDPKPSKKKAAAGAPDETPHADRLKNAVPMHKYVFLCTMK